MKQDSSFCEQKEAKKLHSFAPAARIRARANGQKFFGSFFQKRTYFFPSKG
jgi:hypothetical protein